MPRSLPLVPLLLAAGCIYLPPLVPSDPTHAVVGDPQSAAVEAGGVRVMLHPADWGSDLEAYVTPVELLLENGSGKEIVLRPKLFTLSIPRGARYEALTAGELRRFLRSTSYGYGYGYAGYWYPPAYGPWAWPGSYWGWKRHRPYGYWADPWFVPMVPPPPPPPPVQIPPPPPTATGTLAPGAKGSVLLFFPVPANDLRRFTFEALLVTADGSTVGKIEVPFERLAKGKATRAEPPRSAPPAELTPPRAPAPPPPTPPPAAPAPAPAPEPAPEPAPAVEPAPAAAPAPEPGPGPAP